MSLKLVDYESLNGDVTKCQYTIRGSLFIRKLILFLDFPGGLLADQASPDWTDTLNFLHLGGRNLMDQILLCMVYCLWQERNTRRHEGPWIPHEQTSRLIIEAVKNRIFSLGYRFPHKLIGLLRRWIEVT
ncbi:hypothetical protein F2Q70_00040533 [Brassica cretica]|uniref:Uncharacterized protein n=1 Tax=Brassica cretica TaxID=69181 RepID=A0A8S9K9I1_BRACR|nr:hypothetical protein F2Q70_00040533 [Brassica cretica]